MATIKLKTLKVTTRLDRKFTDPEYIKRTFDTRLEKVRRETLNALQNSIDKEIRKNPVIRALLNPQLGVRGYDLPAEFGLVPGQAEQAVAEFVSTIIRTCKVNIEPETFIRRVRGKPSVAVTIRVSLANPEDYETAFNDYPFAYRSAPSGKKLRGRGRGNISHRIEWMNWLLAGRGAQSEMLGTIPSVKNYGISYDLKRGQSSISRSGRAVMVRDTANNRDRLAIRFFPYEFPEVAKPRAGYKNFVDEIFKNPQFIGKIQAKVQSLVSYYLTPRKR